MQKKRQIISSKLVFFSFTIIPLALYSFFYVYSVVTGIRYSFSDWDGISPDYQFIGLENYRKLVHNPAFWRSLKTTLVYTILLVIGVIVLALILALSLNSLKRFRGFIKSFFFVPAMIGAVTIALIWDQMFLRVLPYIGELLRIPWLSASFLGNVKTALPAVVFVNIWQAVAMPTLIFLSGLQVIPDEQYESAMLDGATTFQKFRYLTFPYILPTVTVNLVLIIKAGFTTFDYSYALTGGGPVRATEVIGIMIYNDAFQNMKFSMANAEACVLFIIIAVFSVIQIKLTSRGGVNT
ncbi:carbohydrate ABC transporter permease [Novisyntrophococcus fermenticellae]|uniref:carbohydrate ABC transporter permease n=1 Tax=Novisyntrophococcus fermenticellae TaxID=2068655 RepID=UPI001E2E2005|nr:sugar ABC transporter permease [Novisyntrophococcus fermenticellae]